MLELMEIVKTSLADIEAKYSSTPAGAVTAEEKAEAIQHTQTEMNSLLFSLDSILIPLVIRRNMLDSASNDIADSYLLGEIDALKCVSSGQHEHTDVMGMEKGKDKVAILLSVSQLSEPDFFHRVLPVPFLLGNKSYVIDVGADLLFEPTTGRLLDQRYCSPAGENTYTCTKIRTRKHACITEAWDDETLIPKRCEFKQMKYSDELFYVRQKEGTLVAQISSEPVVVSYKDKAIRYNPVYVSHTEDLKLSIDGESTLVEGHPEAIFQVRYSGLSHDQLLRHIDPKAYYFKKVIPDSYSDYAYVVLAVAIALLFLPHIYSLIKCLLKCCGVIEKRRGINRWYLPRHYEYARRRQRPTHGCRRSNIEEHCDSDPDDVVRERVAMLPIQAVPQAQERQILNNVLNDARNMSLGQFLRRYVEPRRDLIEFYGMVHSGDSQRSGNRRLH